MREAAIVGVGMTKFGFSQKTQVEMFTEAATDAVNASNLKLKDIQALYVGNADGNVEEGQAVMGPMCAADLGLSGIPASEDVEAAELSRRGEVKSFTVIYTAAEGFTAPYIVGLVETEEGPWVTMSIIDFDPERATMENLMGRKGRIDY